MESSLSSSNGSIESKESLPPPYESATGDLTNHGYASYPGDEHVVISVDGVEIKVEYDKVKADAHAELEEEDPWKLSTVYVEVVPWSELSTCGRVKRILWDCFGKLVLLIVFLYLFICSLDFLSNAFRLIGGKAAGSVFSESSLLSNPVAGLMIGVLATVLLQSSSTSTSIVVSMVAAHIVKVKDAIPIVMGANIGTSVTNTLVSMGQITNKNEFRRAFAGATVHDMFNWLTVIILLPLEVLTGYLFHISEFIISRMQLNTSEGADQEFLKILTEPFTKLIIQVDKKVIEEIAHGIPEAMNKSMIKHCCEKKPVDVIHWNTSDQWNFSFTEQENVCAKKCVYLFEDIANTWSDTTIGIVLLVIALVILCTCLVSIVKTLNSLLQGKVSLIIKKFVNAEFPGKCSYFTGYLAIAIGTGLTILVQSSSIFTSALTPLVGIGVIQIERMYPLTLGSNIGTTTTSILAALAQSAADIPVALQISLCHLFFNLSGILLFYPIPFLRFPIRMAKFLGNITANYRWFAIVYIILMFFVLPAFVFALSLVSWQLMAGVLIPIASIIITIVIITIIQTKAPNCLPVPLRDWKFLPEPCRSLAPYDRVIGKLKSCFSCCKADANDQSPVTEEVKAETPKVTTKL